MATHTQNFINTFSSKVKVNDRSLLLLLKFCYLKVNYSYMFNIQYIFFIYREKMIKTIESDWPLVTAWEQRFGENFLNALETSRFKSFMLRLREMWALSTMPEKSGQSGESTLFIGYKQVFGFLFVSCTLILIKLNVFMSIWSNFIWNQL